MTVSLPFPPLDGTTASGAQELANLQALVAGINNALSRDGTLPATGDLSMGGFRVTGAGTGIGDTDAIVLGQASPTSLTAFQALDTRARFAIYAGAVWAWQTASPPYVADGINVIKANSTALSVGAWVRQTVRLSDFPGSSGLPYQQREFVATVGQTAFAFLYAPLAAYNSVYINGVLLPSTDFTLAGSTLTLATPLVGGENVTIAGFLNGAVADAAAITYGSRTVKARLDETVTVLDKGAVADGFSNAANHVAFDAAITAVAAPGNEFFGGSVTVGRGTYRLTAPVDLPASFARIHGDEDAVVWGAAGQHTFQANGASFVNTTLVGLHLYGGLDAIHAGTPGEIATNKFTDIIATQFTGNGFYFQGGVTSCPITRPFVDGSASTSGCGIVSVGGINNDNSIVDANITGCPGPAVKMLGLTQLLDCRRVRVEHNGQPGVAQYHFEAPLAVRISGWSESSHEYLLKTFNGSANDTAYTVLLDGLVSIGSQYSGGGIVASKFDVGTKRIIFGCNVWANPTQAPARAFIYGVNENLRTENSLVYSRDVMGVQEVTLPQVNFTTAPSLTFILCTITRPSIANVATNSQLCTLTIQGDLRGYSGGGVGGYGAIKWRVAIGALGSDINYQDIYVDPDTLDRLTAIGVSVTLTAVNVTATQVQLQVAITGLNTGLANYLATGVSIRSTAYDPATRFVVTFLKE